MPNVLAVQPDDRGRYAVRCQCGHSHVYSRPGSKYPRCGAAFEILPVANTTGSQASKRRA